MYGDNFAEFQNISQFLPVGVYFSGFRQLTEKSCLTAVAENRSHRKASDDVIHSTSKEKKP